MAHDVFISYSTKDKIIADAVCAKLEENKIRAWIAPRDIPGGENFAKSIIKAINSCKVFILIWSSHTNTSEHIINEINQAFDKGITIIPFRIQNVEPTDEMRYYFGRTHWLDAITPPLEDHIATLRDDILRNLGRELPQIKPEKAQDRIDKKPQLSRKKMLRIMTGIATFATILTIVWFGWSALRNQPSVDPSIPITPQPSLVPTLYNSTIALGTPYYETDFSSIGLDNGEWNLDQDAYLENDMLIVENSDCPIDSKNYVNSIIEVDAKLLDEPVNKKGEEIRIFCRYTPIANSSAYNGYIAHFTLNGEIFVTYQNDGITTTVLSEKVSNLEINRDYQLRFDCKGNTFSIYVDGAKIGEGKHSSFLSGQVGLGSKGSVGFDNFKLWRPE